MHPILEEILGGGGGVLVNHLCYADDICLTSLSAAAGIQQLLNICDTYAKEYDLLYNGSKSHSYVINPNVLYLTDLFLH